MINKMNPYLLCYRIGQFLSMVIAYAWFISSVYSVLLNILQYTLRFGVSVHVHDGVMEDV